MLTGCIASFILENCSFELQRKIKTENTFMFSILFAFLLMGTLAHRTTTRLPNQAGWSILTKLTKFLRKQASPYSLTLQAVTGVVGVSAWTLPFSKSRHSKSGPTIMWCSWNWISRAASSSPMVSGSRTNRSNRALVCGATLPSGFSTWTATRIRGNTKSRPWAKQATPPVDKFTDGVDQMIAKGK